MKGRRSRAATDRATGPVGGTARASMKGRPNRGGDPVTSLAVTHWPMLPR